MGQTQIRHSLKLFGPVLPCSPDGAALASLTCHYCPCQLKGGMLCLSSGWTGTAEAVILPLAVWRG